MKEELTSKMHSEFDVDNETEISHRVHTVITTVEDGDFTLKEALEVYNVTRSQYEKYSQKWINLL